ncbi:MAG: hypothetical protein R3B12_03915 [Candidatus Saccharimonadales bacterium]
MQIQKMLISQAEAVLKANRVGNATKPAPGLYPHQWFWDSCFIAIGLRWTNIEQAKAELRSLAKGQWHNGMIPHIIFLMNQGIILAQTSGKAQNGAVYKTCKQVV